MSDELDTDELDESEDHEGGETFADNHAEEELMAYGLAAE